MNVQSLMPQPVLQPTPVQVLAETDVEKRNQLMREMGARNAVPPLKRSSHLRNKETGRVLPYSDTLATQKDLMECCDAYGNTDPRAWMPTVEPDAEELLALRRAEQFKAQQAVFQQAKTITDQARVPHAVDLTPQPQGYPGDIMSYDELNKLVALVERK